MPHRHKAAHHGCGQPNGTAVCPQFRLTRTPETPNEWRLTTMTHNLFFSTPPQPVQRARLAMARLEAHLAAVIDPMAPDPELTSVAFAFMALEDVHPPYPPLPADLEPSADAAADLDAAIAALGAAGETAASVVDILRYAYAIRDLREITDSPYLSVHLHIDGTSCDGESDW